MYPTCVHIKEWSKEWINIRNRRNILATVCLQEQAPVRIKFQEAIKTSFFSSHALLSKQHANFIEHESNIKLSFDM